MNSSDIIEIHQLLGQYGHAIDASDWTGFASLFTPDAVLDYTAVRAPGVLVGVASIVAYFRTANHPSAHHVSNIVVRDDTDAVRVHSKWFAPYTRSGHLPTRFAGGDYHDVVVPTADGWKFTKKVCLGRWQYIPDAQGDLPEHRRTY